MRLSARTTFNFSNQYNNIDNGPFDIGFGYRFQGLSINEYINRESIICNLSFHKNKLNHQIKSVINI